MQSTKDMLMSIRKFLKPCGECPICGEDLVQVINAETQKPKCQPACMGCGYKVNGKSVQKETEELTMQMLKKNASNYLLNSSVVSYESIFKKTLGQYKTDTPKQYEAYKTAQKIVDDIVKGDIVHGMLTGATGTGKSHLAMGILQEVLKKTNYTKKCMFIDFRELMSQMKVGINDPENFKKYSRDVISEIKKADVVVIDDLGTETSGDMRGSQQASRYVVDVATGIFDSRVDKNIIVTTNLDGKSIRKIYGDRILSRITAHIQGHTMLFNGMTDYRIKH